MEKEEIAELLGAEVVATDLDLVGGILFGVNYLVNERRKRELRRRRAMPNVDRECTNHHAACDCREVRIANLINLVKGKLEYDTDPEIRLAVDEVDLFITNPLIKNESYNDGFRDGEQSAQRKYAAEIESLRKQVKELEQRHPLDHPLLEGYKVSPR